MIEEWYLLITLFVLQSDGIVDKRELHPVRYESHMICEQESYAQINHFTSQLGNNRITLFSTYNSDTYEIGLNGMFVGFQVGCKELDQRWKE